MLPVASSSGPCISHILTHLKKMRQNYHFDTPSSTGIPKVTDTGPDDDFVLRHNEHKNDPEYNE